MADTFTSKNISDFRLNYASATVDKYDSFIPDILCNCVSDAIIRNRN